MEKYDKYRAANNLDEIVKVQSDAQYEDPHHDRNDGLKNYRGKTRIDGYWFHYVVRIGKKDGEKFMYELNLKAADANKDLGSKGTAPTLPTASKYSISHPDPTVKNQFSFSSQKTDNAPAGVEDFDVQKKGVNPELQKQLDDHNIVQSDGDVQDTSPKQFHNLPFPQGKDMITEKAPLGSLWCGYFRTVNGSTSAPSLVISKCRWLSSAASNSAELPTVLITSPRLML